jgi:hypothetical protein
MQWTKGTNQEGYPVWRMVIPQWGLFPQGWIADYSPGVPPYHAFVRVPWLVDKWFVNLDDAKFFVEQGISCRLMGIEYKEGV